MKTPGIVLTFIAIAMLIFVGLQFRKGSGPVRNVFDADPVKFVYKATAAPGAAAVINGKTISEMELLERSAVLSDLGVQEVKMLGEATVKSAGSKAKSDVLEIFLPDPGEKFQRAVEKLKLPLEIRFSSEKPDGQVAQLNGKGLSQKDLGLSQLQYSLLKSKQFAEKLAVLRDLLVKQILFKAAKDDGKNIEEYVNAKILKGGVKVSDQEINDFMGEKGITFGKDAQSMRNRLRLILLEQKRTSAINSFIKENFEERGEIHFLPPQDLFPLNESKAIISKGHAGAVPVLVFSNLQCSTCVQLGRNLLNLKDKYKDRIRIGFVNFFSPEDWRSRLAAEAALCLNAQDHKHFWNFFAVTTNTPAQIEEAAIYDMVKKIGAGTEPFKSCLLKQQYKEEVNAQLKYSADLGVITMPTVIIGSQVLAGAISAQEIEQAIAASGPAPAGWFSWLKGKP